MSRCGPLPPVYLLAAIVLMVLLHRSAPGATLLVFPWNLIGLPPLAGGIALEVAAGVTFRRHGTSLKPHKRPSALVTGGVYAFTRNPMYLGASLMLLGIGLLLGTSAPLFVVLAFAWAMDRLFIRAEERALAETFGPGWDAYRRRVRRWL